MDEFAHPDSEFHVLGDELELQRHLGVNPV